MASLVLALLVVFLGLLFLLLALPTLLIIKARQDRSRASLELAVCPLAGRLRFRVFAIPRGETGSKGNSDAGGLLEALPAALGKLGSAAAGGQKLSKRLAVLRRAVMAAWWAIRQPGCRCTKLDIKVRFGLNDAAATAVATGLAHAAFALSQSALANSVHFARGVYPQISLEPSYEGVEASGAVDCIFSIPLGYIIGRGVARLLRLRLSPKKVA